LEVFQLLKKMETGETPCPTKISGFLWQGLDRPLSAPFVQSGAMNEKPLNPPPTPFPLYRFPLSAFHPLSVCSRKWLILAVIGAVLSNLGGEKKEKITRPAPGTGTVPELAGATPALRA
jgi:hypothetical protein